MTDDSIASKLPDADMQGAPKAMLRASLRAREIARRTNTPIVVMREGALVEEIVDAVAEAEWAAEIRRRIAALDAGAPTMPWDEARKRIASA